MAFPNLGKRHARLAFCGAPLGVARNCSAKHNAVVVEEGGGDLDAGDGCADEEGGGEL